MLLPSNSGDDEQFKILIFGGQSNEEFLSRAFIVDFSLEIFRLGRDKGDTLLNAKIGKIYYPMCQIDQRRYYIFSGYSDNFLQPYILDTKTFKLERVDYTV